MHDEDVVDPIPCPEAFGENGESASYSQAALLLALAIVLKPQYQALLATLVESAPFSLPELRRVEQPVPGEHFARVLSAAERQVFDTPAHELQHRAAADHAESFVRLHRCAAATLIPARR